MESHSCAGVLDKKLYDKVCWCGRSVFSLSIQVSSTNKDISRNITEILLKVALSTLTITLTFFIIRNYFSSISVKPVLRGHLWDKEKVDRWPLIEVNFIWNFLDRTRKRWPFNASDCLIVVTARAGLTDFFIFYRNQVQKLYDNFFYLLQEPDP